MTMNLNAVVNDIKARIDSLTAQFKNLERAACQAYAIGDTTMVVMCDRAQDEILARLCSGGSVESGAEFRLRQLRSYLDNGNYAASTGDVEGERAADRAVWALYCSLK